MAYILAELLQEMRENFQRSFPDKKPPSDWRDRSELKPFLEKVERLNLSPADRQVVTETVNVLLDLADFLEIGCTHNQELVFKGAAGLRTAMTKIDALTRKEECDKERPWLPN